MEEEDIWSSMLEAWAEVKANRELENVFLLALKGVID